jgi:hypothetical protein
MPDLALQRGLGPAYEAQFENFISETFISNKTVYPERFAIGEPLSFSGGQNDWINWISQPKITDEIRDRQKIGVCQFE